jgi:Tfp pilus assembly protein PilF
MLNSNSADRSTLSQVHTLLGDAYQELEEPETAEQHYQQALSVDSTNQVAKNNYAYFLAVQGKSLDQALAMMEDVMATHPDNASYQDTYGWIFYKQGQYEKALKWVEKAYKQSASPEVAEHLGDIYYRLDQPEQAIQYWQEAQEKGRDSERLREKIESGKL